MLAPVTQPDYDWQLPHLECMDAHWFQQISTARVLQDLAESRAPAKTNSDPWLFMCLNNLLQNLAMLP